VLGCAASTGFPSCERSVKPKSSSKDLLLGEGTMGGSSLSALAVAWAGRGQTTQRLGQAALSMAPPAECVGWQG